MSLCRGCVYRVFEEDRDMIINSFCSTEELAKKCCCSVESMNVVEGMLGMVSTDEVRVLADEFLANIIEEFNTSLRDDYMSGEYSITRLEDKYDINLVAMMSILASMGVAVDSKNQL